MSKKTRIPLRKTVRALAERVDQGSYVPPVDRSDAIRKRGSIDDLLPHTNYRVVSKRRSSHYPIIARCGLCGNCGGVLSKNQYVSCPKCNSKEIHFTVNKRITRR